VAGAHEHLVGSQVGEGDADGLGRIDVVRHRHEVALRADGELRIAADDGELGDALTDVNAGDAGAKRILFLVDRGNLGRQTVNEFQQFTTPDDGRQFTDLRIMPGDIVKMERRFDIDAATLEKVCVQVKEIHALGVQVVVVFQP
jgi:hypothetical protein